MMKKILFSTTLIVALGIVITGCGNSSSPGTDVAKKTEQTLVQTSVESNKKSEEKYEKKKKESHLSAEPSSFRKYALVANGKISVKNKLTTDGPLADVHANGLISANTRSLDISGRITSKNKLGDAITRSFNYEGNVENKKIVSIRALKVLLEK